MHAFVVRASDCVREIVTGQCSQEVADQKDGVVSETVRQFLDAFRDFAIFEIAETAIEVADLLPRVVHEIRDLFGGETDPPQHTLVTFHRECFVEHAQALGVLEVVQVFLFAGLDEIHHLGEHLDEGSGPTALFGE